MLDLLASVPNIAFMPLIVAFLGLGLEPKMMIVFLAAVVPITINSHAAIRQVDPALIEAAMTLGATRLTALRKIIWPSALPAIIAGFRIGATQALTACVMAQLYTAMTDLGGLLSGYSNGFNMPRYFVTVITLALIGIFSTFLLRLVERRITTHLIGITL
jgi:ABC-type nitrate/sulfonate/bicarbonate transport system permease component